MEDGEHSENSQNYLRGSCFAAGVLMAGLGRWSGSPIEYVQPFALPASDLVMRRAAGGSPFGVAEHALYGAGVALVYVDKIAILANEIYKMF